MELESSEKNGGKQSNPGLNSQGVFTLAYLEEW